MLQSAFIFIQMTSQTNLLVSLRSVFTAALIFSALLGSVYAQQPEATPASTAPAQQPSERNASGTFTAEQIAESVIFIYGNGGGRLVLDQIRKTTVERGRIETTTAEGKIERATFQRWIIRGENSMKDRVRYELDLPNARYSMVSKDEKIYGIFNDSTFSPRGDAVTVFQNQTFRGLDALLRYKENESTIAVGEKEKVMGVGFHTLDVTDKQGRKTRFYISEKTFRVMMLEYTDGDAKYKRKFYDYRVAQGTLVPYRTVLWIDGKQVEEMSFGTYTFGQRVDESLFPDA